MKCLLDNGCEFNEEALVYSLMRFGKKAFSLIKKTQFFVDNDYVFPKNILSNIIERDPSPSFATRMKAVFSFLIANGVYPDEKVRTYLRDHYRSTKKIK